MTVTDKQIQISATLVASAQRTTAEFEKNSISLTATTTSPVLLVFSATYLWEKEIDGSLNDWDFYLTITDEEDVVLKSDYQHFGEDEPGLIGSDELSYQEYLKEEDYLKHYKRDDPLRKGQGVMVRSLRTPEQKGSYIFRCKITSQLWSRRLGEEKGLEKNKTQAEDECEVRITVK